MTKNKSVKQLNTMSREEQLERENELLRLEIAYLKKFRGESGCLPQEMYYDEVERTGATN